jgi:hypothetical protein
MFKFLTVVRATSATTASAMAALMDAPAVAADAGSLRKVPGIPVPLQ